VILLIVGILFDQSLLTSIGTALAIFAFLYTQYKDNKTPFDEREKFIVERAYSVSFLVIISLLLLGSVLNDFIEFLNFVSLEEIFQILIGLGFMTFVSTYTYISVKI
jgi:hypothetical protein